MTLDSPTYNAAAEKGDNWPSTWLADGEQMAIVADGKAFAGGFTTCMTFGVTRFNGASGGIGQWMGTDVISSGNIPCGYGKGGIKASGLLQVNGIIYAIVRNAGPNGTQSMFRSSTDNGQNWTNASWKFEEFPYAWFINEGQNYGANSDGYVYLYSMNSADAYTQGTGLWLARVPKVQILTEGSWQYWKGNDANGNPIWSSAISERQLVFVWNNHIYRGSAIYNPGLGRYFITFANKIGAGNGETPGTKSAIYVFDSPAPWGPFTTAYINEDWPNAVAGTGDANPLSPQFPPKWVSATSMYLQWSCFPCKDGDNYRLHTVRMNLSSSRRR